MSRQASHQSPVNLYKSSSFAQDLASVERASALRDLRPQTQVLEADLSREIKKIRAVLAAFELGNQEEKVYEMSFHETYNVEDAIKRLQKLVQNGMNINIDSDKINFLHKSAILDT